MESIVVLDSDSEFEAGLQSNDFISDEEREGIREIEDDEEVTICGDSKPCKMGKRKIEKGDLEFKNSLPFMCNAPKMVQCLVCQYAIYREAILCSVRGCQASFHLKCAKDGLGFSSLKQFKCPQHACFLCKRENRLWRCVRCPMASHDRCTPFPEHVIRLPDRPQEVICWRHPTDWLLSKHEVPATRIEEIFSCLPLPCNDEEFKTVMNWKDLTENKLEPPPYEQIK